MLEGTFSHVQALFLSVSHVTFDTIAHVSVVNDCGPDMRG